ncbi:LD-carboxypeptidase [Actinospica durhamensis]|uniref:LD-carboxypeptidase n=1 Tax=Actinospica durhamensis TaxID=1508375 RepID=A0A941ER11_9ACTN|nr:LD-carboxypeptidase [Actinospica durhamensis]MBR7834918.1 LD-carboxypeptidase [Actinospica durhamensis]
MEPPRPVLPSHRLRVVSPGMPTLYHVPERGKRAEAALTALGFEVGYSPHAHGLSDDGITSGTPRERAADLMEAFADPEVDALLISDSGTGSLELLDLLDPEVIKANPKPLIGFCDTVFLHQYLAGLGIGSYYGCSLMFHLGDVGGPFPETIRSLTRALGVEAPLECRPLGDRAAPPTSWHDPASEAVPRVRDHPGGWTWLRPGRGAGPLLGGEISQLPEVVERFKLDYRGVLLFWDVTEVQDQPVDTLIRDLAAATDLTGLAGMVVGANPQLDPPVWAAEVAAALERHVPEAAYPVVVNADICHMTPSWVLPFGEYAELDDHKGLSFPRTRG